MRIVIEGRDLPGAELVSDGVALHDVHLVGASNSFHLFRRPS